MVLFKKVAFLLFRRTKKLSFVFTWRFCCILLISILTAPFILPELYCRFVQILFTRSCSNENYLPKNFDFKVNILAEPTKCNDDEKLLIFVPSVAGKYEERSFVRETWARPFFKQANVKLIFIVAYNTLTLQSLRQESDKHHDLLWFDFEEHYHNITLKIFNLFEWISRRCPNVPHILRADPDIVIFKKGLDEFLMNHRSEKKTINGYCRGYDCVMRYPYSKTCMPRSWYSNVWYPKYCFGFSYLFTSDILKEILPIWRKKRYFPLDDILFTGLIAEESSIAITRTSYKSLFDYQKLFDRFPCGSKHIAAATYDNLQEARFAWSRFSKTCEIY